MPVIQLYCCESPIEPPIAVATPTFDEGDIQELDLFNTIWNDNCDNANATERLAKWSIYINNTSGTPIVAYPYATLDASISLGTNSTYQQLRFPNGVAQIISVIQAQGITLQEDDIIYLVATVMNCAGLVSSDDVGVEFTATCCEDALLTEDGSCLITESLICVLLEDGRSGS